MNIDIRRVLFRALSISLFVVTLPLSNRADGQTATPHKAAQQQPVVKTNGNAAAIAFAAIADREVSLLRDGITLAKFMDIRGKGEHWEYTKPEIVPTEPHPECVSLVNTVALPSGAKAARALYFYPPSPPAAAVFPTLKGSKLISSCILALIRVEAEAPTPEIGHLLAEAARQQLAKRYRESIGRGAFWSPGNYGDATRWIHDTEIISGYNSKPGLDSDAPGQLLRGPVAFVAASLPLAQKLQREECCTFKTYRYLPTERAQFHSALGLAGADIGLSGRLEMLYEQVFQAADPPGQAQRPENAKWRESLLPVLRDWLVALTSVSPSQHAAGLLAADRLLVAAADAGRIPGWPKGPEGRSELQELGAVFELNEIAGGYFYTRNWEKQAGELNPNGAVGQMAAIGSLLRGSCDTAGSEFFRKVILDGEGLLARGLDAQTAAAVHFMVGDAYSDIVAIAGGDAGSNGEYDPDQFKDEADRDHDKALQHYRAGFAVDSTSENAKDAWRQAWRLSAGLLPSERYVCFGD